MSARVAARAWARAATSPLRCLPEAAVALPRAFGHASPPPAGHDLEAESHLLHHHESGTLSLSEAEVNARLKKQAQLHPHHPPPHPAPTASGAEAMAARHETGGGAHRCAHAPRDARHTATLVVVACQRAVLPCCRPRALSSCTLAKTERRTALDGCIMLYVVAIDAPAMIALEVLHVPSYPPGCLGLLIRSMLPHLRPMADLLRSRSRLHELTFVKL